MAYPQHYTLSISQWCWIHSTALSIHTKLIVTMTYWYSFQCCLLINRRHNIIWYMIRLTMMLFCQLFILWNKDCKDCRVTTYHMSIQGIVMFLLLICHFIIVQLFCVVVGWELIIHSCDSDNFLSIYKNNTHPAAEGYCLCLTFVKKWPKHYHLWTYQLGLEYCH